jgi:hypothetical protein
LAWVVVGPFFPDWDGRYLKMDKSSSPRGSFHANARACEQNPVIGTTDEPFFVFFSAKGVSRFWRARLLAHDYLSKNKKDEPSN